MRAAASEPQTESADLEAKASELKDLILYWSDIERAVFKEPSPAEGARAAEASGDFADPPRRAQVFVLGQRRRALHLLRGLCMRHNAGDDVPAALTLFDALVAVTGRRSGDEAPRILEPTAPFTLAAVARLAVKCGSSAAFEDGTFTDPLVLRDLAALGAARACEEEGETSVTCAEAGIMTALSWRTRLTPPLEWTWAIFSRLEALCGVRGVSLDAGLEVWRRVEAWACVIAERVPASDRAPPRTLALGACAMGLVAAGVLIPDEVRPDSVQADVWQASIRVHTAQVGAVGEGPPAGTAGFAELLAESACCEVEELKRRIPAALEALHSASAATL